MSGPLDKFFFPSNRNSNRHRHRQRPPHNAHELQIEHFVYEISTNLDIKKRIKANNRNIDYKYDANYHLLKQNKNKKGYLNGYPREKRAAIKLAKQIHGDRCVTTGDHDAFGRKKEYRCGYWRCEVCREFPDAMLKATHYPVKRGLFAAEGVRWDIVIFIEHFTNGPHKQAVKESRCKDKERWLLQHPSENVNDYTANPLLRQCIAERTVLYELRVEQIAQVYTDMKCLSVSSYSYPARALSKAYATHLIELGSKPYEEFKPTEMQCRYNSPTAHGRYRKIISDDIFNYYLKPLFGDDLLAASVAYDGWRAFAELYIHGTRLVFRDGSVKHVVVGLIDPPCDLLLFMADIYKDQMTANDIRRALCIKTGKLMEQVKLDYRIKIAIRIFKWRVRNNCY